MVKCIYRKAFGKGAHMKKYTLWIIIAAVAVSAVLAAYLTRSDPPAEYDDAAVPKSVAVKDKHGEEQTNRLLSDVGSWSVKTCLLIDGKEYDLYATFDDPEKALENVKAKCPDALLQLNKGSFLLGELSDRNWERYRDVLASKDIEAAEQADTLAAFFDIYENAGQNEEIIKLADELSSAGRDKAGELYSRIMMTLPYTSLER